MNEAKTKKLLSAIAIAIFIALSVAIMWFIGRPLIEFIEKPDQFRAWVNDNGALGRLAFVGMIVLQVVVAIIPGEPFEIGAGYAFGIIEGTALCLIGVIIGSAIIYAIVKCFGVKAVEVFFPREKIDSLKFLQNTKRFNTMVFIISFIPGTPKDLLSYFIGLTKMKMSTWLLIVSISRIPSIITSVIGGDAIYSQNWAFAIIVFAATGVIAAVGLVIYNRLGKSDKAETEQ